ncbi:TPA: hypothetical protein VIF74_001426, partial [Streptococcus pyogenes]|nr:hypothetical protein [Streptococcus pyogenes]
MQQPFPSVQIVETAASLAETVWFSGVARLRLTTAAVAIINKDNFF